MRMSAVGQSLHDFDRLKSVITSTADLPTSYAKGHRETSPVERRGKITPGPRCCRRRPTAPLKGTGSEWIVQTCRPKGGQNVFLIVGIFEWQHLAGKLQIQRRINCAHSFDVFSGQRVSSYGRLGGRAQQEGDQMPRIEPQCIVGPPDRFLWPSRQEVSDRAAWKPEKHAGVMRTEATRTFEHFERAFRLTTQGISEAVSSTNPH